ncbi:MAG: holB [Candidatus Nomurabacteria bacterium]|nr:holB [Candidatus Nomurabacteria bacterium]
MKISDLPNHHAVLLVNESRVEASELLWGELASSPANRFFNQTVLDIDTARDIISWAGESNNDDRVGLITFHTASIPAQNAMLKVLEEPRPNVRFILITSNKRNVIDTVLSRTQIVDSRGSMADSENTLKSNSQAEEFLETSPTLRMKLPFIAGLLSKTDEEGRKDRESVRSFILSLITVLEESKSKPEVIMETLEIASYASDPSASGKALIEYLALLLPFSKGGQ